MIAPATLIMGYFFVYVRMHLDLSLAAFAALAIAFATALSAFNASRPVYRPQTRETPH